MGGRRVEGGRKGGDGGINEICAWERRCRMVYNMYKYDGGRAKRDPSTILLINLS